MSARNCVLEYQTFDNDSICEHRLERSSTGKKAFHWTTLLGSFSSLVGLLLRTVEEKKTLIPLILVSFGLLLMMIRRLTYSPIAAESVLIIKQLGVQLKTQYTDGREDFQFIDMERIKAVIINEGFTMHKVIFYMAFIIEGDENLVVAFQHLKPKLDTLIPIYRNTNQIIFGDSGSGISSLADQDSSSSSFSSSASLN